MKKIILLLSILLVAAQLLNAQDKDRNLAGGNKNMVKINLFALALKNVTVQYEREISKKTTVAIDVRTMPKSGLPFESSFRNAISDQSTKDQLDNFKGCHMTLKVYNRILQPLQWLFRFACDAHKSITPYDPNSLNFIQIH